MIFYKHFELTINIFCYIIFKNRTILSFFERKITLNDIVSLSKLNFFKIEKNIHTNTHIFDMSNIPRPHYCMGLLKKGTAVFKDYTDSSSKEEIFLSEGDIIFVPVASKYISEWKGNPDIEYTSFHFTFDFPGIFSREGNFKLQKIDAGFIKNAEEIFEFALLNFNKDYSSMLCVLSDFYKILGEIIQVLKTIQLHMLTAGEKSR